MRIGPQHIPNPPSLPPSLPPSPVLTERLGDIVQTRLQDGLLVIRKGVLERVGPQRLDFVLAERRELHDVLDFLL